KNIGDPITNEDVEKNVKIPEGGKIVSIGDKPGTDTPGVKPVVPVVIELPNGKQITVEVPVIVKPKVTPVVVKVGTPVTEEDVKKHVDLPEGWKVTKVGEIPTTATPGAKPSVTVEVELPDGRKVTVEVPVTVTPKHVEPSTPAGPTTPEQPQGENGNKPQPETPAKPEKPSENTKPEVPKAPVAKAGEKVLPNTGIADNNSALAGLGLAILGLATAARRRKQK
ncbi:LPXTG cell wall anchor domain-containing protein, partial [Gemella haemolysans]